ncbi:MAG: heme A synthase [Gammaproteobacteria bacterium HGW-Gammaproteobacteria-4]|jgi:cytochrome c oxidase assembly protein subunit 15|nr:MAG: heme A synthase [Gammaproteobacteria bacterium HGW-Gammaproteobacteria-4]
MLPLHRHFHRIAWLAVALAAVVIVFGAFVRLSHAGLSCPDWPTCYGQAAWPTHEHEIAAANDQFERPVEVNKTWREQFHRHIAASLGLLVLALALLTRRADKGVWWVLAASGTVAVSIALYIDTHYFASAILAATGEAVLLALALRASPEPLARLAPLTLAVIVFQALLGMWTVTWLLKPVVVMAHLLGGLATFSLLLTMAWRSTAGRDMPRADLARIRPWLWMALTVLVLQIALGGWTSANYAALACGADFPTCQGLWWPSHDFQQGFVLWRGIGVDYEGGVLDGPARVAIHLAHRLGAVAALVLVLASAIRLLRSSGLAAWGWLLIVVLLAQIGLGISNVVLGLPLWVAVAHNAGALLLLAILVSLLARLRATQI